MKIPATARSRTSATPALLAALAALATLASPAAARADEPTPEPQERATEPLPAPASPTPASPPPALRTSAGASAEAPLPAPREPSASGRAADAGDEPAPGDVSQGLGRTSFLRIGAGVRIGYLGSAGYDPFSTNDVLPQLSLEATHTLATAGRVSFAAGVAWDWGGSSARARGVPSSVFVHRIAVPLEARYHAFTGFYGFARVAPGLLTHSFALEGGSEGTARDDLGGGGAGFGADLAVGASLLAVPRNKPEKRTVRFWITPELGYALATKRSVRLTPDAPDERIGEFAAVALPTFATTGPYFRISLAMTY